MININNIAPADVLQIPDYQTLVDENVAILQQLIPDYQPLESDDHMLLIEAFSYRELHLRQLFNNKLKRLLLLYATGNDLDLAAVPYGVERLDNETDDEFRNRVLKSLDGHSTAGSQESYEFHAYSVSSDIDDVNAFSPEKGKVTVALASFEDESDLEIITPELITQVDTALNETKVRPITDEVTVVKATINGVAIVAQIFIFNMDDEAAITEKIINNFATKLKIGQVLTYSQLIRYLHVDGVFKVNLISHDADIACGDDEILKINNIDLTFESADEAI